jgi:hypothetical protein
MANLLCAVACFLNLLSHCLNEISEYLQQHQGVILNKSSLYAGFIV